MFIQYRFMDSHSFFFFTVVSYRASRATFIQLILSICLSVCLPVKEGRNEGREIRMEEGKGVRKNWRQNQKIVEEENKGQQQLQQ